MGFPKKVTLFPKGSERCVTEMFAAFCKANGVDRVGGKALLDRWERDGDIVRRRDGAFDMIKFHERHDSSTTPTV